MSFIHLRSLLRYTLTHILSLFPLLHYNITPSTLISLSIIILKKLHTSFFLPNEFNVFYFSFILFYYTFAQYRSCFLYIYFFSFFSFLLGLVIYSHKKRTNKMWLRTVAVAELVCIAHASFLYSLVLFKGIQDCAFDCRRNIVEVTNVWLFTKKRTLQQEGLNNEQRALQMFFQLFPFGCVNCRSYKSE